MYLRRPGQSLSEYGLVAALVLIVSFVGLKLLGQTLNLNFGAMIPGPTNLANAGGVQGAPGSNQSGGLSGSNQAPGGGGVDDILTSNPQGQGQEVPGTVQTAGGLGNQDQNGSAQGQQSGGYHSDQGAGDEDVPEELPMPVTRFDEPEEAEQVSQGTRIAQQLQQYSAQMKAFASKFDPSSPLYHAIMDMSQKNQDLGTRVIDYENARNQGMSPQQGMMMGRGLGYSIRDYDTIMMGIHQGNEYPNLSAQDKETLNTLVRSSASTASEIFNSGQ